MKKTFLSLIAAAFITLAIIGCKGGAGSDPKATVIAFFDAMKKKDFDGAEKYATKETKSFLDLMKLATSMAGMGNKDDMDFDKIFNLQNATYGDAKIEGDNASVALLVDGKEQMPVILKKENGDWKVAFDMATIMSQAIDKKHGLKGDTIIDSANAIQDIDIKGLKDSVNNAMDKLKELQDSVKANN